MEAVNVLRLDAKVAFSQLELLEQSKFEVALKYPNGEDKMDGTLHNIIEKIKTKDLGALKS